MEREKNNKYENDNYEFIQPSLRDDAPLAGIINPEIEDIDPRKFFPDFRPDKILRFSRLLGASAKTNRQAHLYYYSKSYVRNPDQKNAKLREDLRNGVEKPFKPNFLPPPPPEDVFDEAAVSLAIAAKSRRASSTAAFDLLERNKMAQGDSQYQIVERGSLYSLDYRLFFKGPNGYISPWHDIPLHAHDQRELYNMIVMNPRWTNAKMEMATKEPLTPIKQDEKNGRPRFVHNIFPHRGYIWNYGALPQTWEDPNHEDEHTNAKGDNDPIDVIEIGSQIQKRGAVVQVKIIGTLALLDEGETDWKLVAISAADPLFDKVSSLAEAEEHFPGLLKATEEWFRIYKIPTGKPANEIAFNGEFKNADFANKIIAETHEFWKLLMKEASPKLNTEAHVEGAVFAANDEEWNKAVESSPPLSEPKETPADNDKWHFIHLTHNESNLYRFNFEESGGEGQQQPQEFYVDGSENSGQQVLGPRGPSNPSSDEEDNHGIPQRVGSLVKVKIISYRDGFTVDDGPLRPFYHPQNLYFCICLGFNCVPLEFLQKYPNCSIDFYFHKILDVHNPLQEIQFKICGQKLIKDTAASITDQMQTRAQESIILRNGEPITRIQFNLPMGHRITGTFNPSMTVVNHLRTFVVSADPAINFFGFFAGVPPHKLEDETLTIEGAGLNNSVVTVRLF